MNCQQFISLIVEAARGRMMDAASRADAMRHTESCEACAARLAQEQSLTSALRAVAVGMKDLSAPASVEAKLLTAFQESLAQQNATAATTNASTPHAPASLTARSASLKLAASRPARRVANAATAIAASLVLVMLAAALYLRFTQTAPPSLQDITRNDQPNVTKASPPAKELPLAAPSPATPIESAIESGQQPRRERPDINRGVKSQRAAFKYARAHTPTMIKAQHVIDGGNAIIEASAGETIAANTPAARPSEAESVTEFISLVADAPAAQPLESGQLVRVQVPRAALASLGLPLNAERGNEPVKADVLLGGDGLARAIRFVR